MNVRKTGSSYAGWAVALVLAVILFFTVPQTRHIKEILLEKSESGIRQTLADIPRDALYFLRQLILPKNEA